MIWRSRSARTPISAPLPLWRRLAARGAPFRLGSDAGKRLRHGALPRPRNELAPPAPNAPQVGAELAAVLELRAVLRLPQFEGLEHVRHRAAHEPKGYALRSLESDRLHGRGGQTGAERREVPREDHVGAVLDHVELRAPRPRRPPPVGRGGDVEHGLARRADAYPQRAPRAGGAARARI